MPKQSGRATKNTTTLAGKSAFKVLNMIYNKMRLENNGARYSTHYLAAQGVSYKHQKRVVVEGNKA
jgi:hypothetical protein